MAFVTFKNAEIPSVILSDDFVDGVEIVGEELKEETEREKGKAAESEERNCEDSDTAHGTRFLMK